MTNVEGRGISKIVPVTVDGTMALRADAKDGYELRNVRIQDPDYLVTIAESAQH